MSDDSPFGDFQPAEMADSDTPIALGAPDDYTHFNPTDTNDDMTAFESQTEGMTHTDAHTDDPFGDAPVPENTQAAEESQVGFDFVPQEEKQEPDEQSPLAIWEQQRAIELDTRKRKAEEEKQQLLQTAKEESTKFYADQEARLEKNKKTNRADEKTYRSDMKSLFENGTRWEKVNKLVNLQPKAGEKPGTSRVDRMRKVLITLKNTKEEKKSL